MLSAVHREFIRRVMLARTRRIGTKSINYFASLREFVRLMMGILLDFAASWGWRITAIYWEPSKGSWKEESLMKCEATPDSAMTRFSFRKERSRLSANYQPK